MHLAATSRRNMGMRPIHSVIFSLGLVFSLNAYAAPYVPLSDAEVLAQVPTRLDPEARALAGLRQQLSKAPQNLDAAVAYAEEALKIGHARSDPRYYGYAEAALGPWWALNDAPQRVLVLRATIHQFFHAFDSARTDLDRALARNPGDSQARLIRATVLQVQGYPDKALADCGQLGQQVAVLISTACASSASSLMGRAKRADALLGFVLDQSKPDATDSKLWAETLRAEIAERLGRTTDAQAAYQRALATMDALGVNDAYLLAAWADFSIKQGQSSVVIDRLKGLADVDNLLLRLTLAEHATGKHDESFAQHKNMLEARFAAARQRGDAVHLREESIYQLHLNSDPSTALGLAQKNWKTQREPIDALILLEAAQATHQADAALLVKEWMRETQIEDERLNAVLGAMK